MATPSQRSHASAETPAKRGKGKTRKSASNSSVTSVASEASTRSVTTTPRRETREKSRHRHPSIHSKTGSGSSDRGRHFAAEAGELPTASPAPPPAITGPVGCCLPQTKTSPVSTCAVVRASDSPSPYPRPTAKKSAFNASETSVAAEEPTPALTHDIIMNPAFSFLEKTRRQRSSIHLKVLKCDPGRRADVESAVLPTARSAPSTYLNTDHSGRSLCSEDAHLVSRYVGIRDTETQTPDFRRPDTKPVHYASNVMRRISEIWQSVELRIRPHLSGVLPQKPYETDRRASAMRKVAPQSHFHPPSPVALPKEPLLPILRGAVSVTFCITVGLGYVFLFPAAPTGDDVCSSLECSEYGKTVSSSIDASVNPCQGFTRFVCSGWERQHQLSVREEYYGRVLEQVARALRNVDMPPPGHDQNSVQRAAAVYRSCRGLLHNKIDQLKTVRNALENAGITWPRDAAAPDLVFTLVYSALKLGWDAIVSVTLRVSEQKTTLAVDPGLAFHYVMQSPHASDTGFKRYFHVLRDSFGTAGSGDPDSDERLIASAEGSVLRKLMDAYAVRQRPEAMPDGLYLGLGLSRWKFNLMKLFPTISESLQLVTAGKKFLEAFLDFWDERGEIVAHIFASWCTVQVAALYANEHLIVNYYNSFPRAQVYYEAFCLTRAYVFSPRAVFDRYNTLALGGHRRTSAEHIAKSVGDAFLRRLSRRPHYQGSIATIANLSAMPTAFRRFNITTPDHDLVGYNMNDSLVQNWATSALLSRSANDSIVMTAIESLQLFALFLSEDGRRSFQLIPPAAYFPFFDTALASAINYGGLGSQVASALGRLLTIADSELSSDDQLTAAIKDLTECVTNGSPAEYMEVITDVALTANVLVDAFESDVQVNGREVPHLGRFTPTQLLLVALCFVHCLGSDRGNFRSVCDWSLKHVKAFSQAFNCPPGSPMNPTHRCDVP
ncbi:endothelin-converting enzyme 1-like [Haemaphysalis longicornis]